MILYQQWMNQKVFKPIMHYSIVIVMKQETRDCLKQMKDTNSDELHYFIYYLYGYLSDGYDIDMDKIIQDYYEIYVKQSANFY